MVVCAGAGRTIIRSPCDEQLPYPECQIITVLRGQQGRLVNQLQGGQSTQQRSKTGGQLHACQALCNARVRPEAKAEMRACVSPSEVEPVGVLEHPLIEVRSPVRAYDSVARTHLHLSDLDIRYGNPALAILLHWAVSDELVDCVGDELFVIQVSHEQFSLVRVA